MGALFPPSYEGSSFGRLFPGKKIPLPRNPVIYLAGGLFHLGLFVVLILGGAHMLVWKSLLGFGWPTLPLPIVDWFAAVTIVAMIVLFINRLINPVLKLISGPAEWLNLLVRFSTNDQRLYHDASSVVPL